MFNFIEFAKQNGVDPNAYAGGDPVPVDDNMFGGQVKNPTMGMDAPPAPAPQQAAPVQPPVQAPAQADGEDDVLRKVQELQKPAEITNDERKSRNWQLLGAALKFDGGDAVRQVKADFESKDKSRMKDAAEAVTLARNLRALEKEGMDLDTLRRETASAKAREAAEKDSNSNVTKLMRQEALANLELSGISPELKEQYKSFINQASAYDMKTNSLLASLGNFRALDDAKLDKGIKLAQVANQAAEETRKAQLHPLDMKSKQAEIDLKEAQATATRNKPAPQPKETALQREKGKRTAALALDGDAQLNKVNDDINMVDSMMALVPKVNAGPIEGRITPPVWNAENNQTFDRYVANLKLKAAELMKGQGTITEPERQLLADTTISRNSDPAVITKYLTTLKTVMERNRDLLQKQVAAAKVASGESEPVPTVNSKAELDALPSGTKFIGPDGKERVKK